MLSPRYRAATVIAFARKKSGHEYKNQSTISTGATLTRELNVPKPVDFITGARAFKKSQMINNLTRGLLDALYIILAFALVIMTTGVLISWKYHGRALPFTYVGDVAIGGMNKQQIIDTLDARFNNMQITLVEGGLVRQVPISQFNIKADTTALSNQVIQKRVSPFSYLNWQRYDVPISMNDRIVAGYVARVINPSQTKSTDAQLVIDKNKLTIKPALVGFQTNPNFIAEQIKLALSRASTPNISVNSVTIKPKVYASDLTDDLAQANTMLQTPVTIKYGYASIKPTFAQKLSWLKIDQSSGSKNVGLDFSQGLVRAYIIDQTNKLQKDVNLTTGNTVAIDNIDEVTDGVIAALKNGSTSDQQLTLHVNNTVSFNTSDTTADLSR